MALLSWRLQKPSPSTTPQPLSAPHRPAAAVFTLPFAHIHRLAFSPLHKRSALAISATISPTLQISPLKSTEFQNSDRDLLSGSTRTVTTLLLAAAATASRLFASGIYSTAAQLREPPLAAVGPAFFAAMREESTGGLNTPLTVVAAGMAKWLDIYSGVLMVRVMLSWFPNIPWDRQPLSAIRDLCDPYLNLFRNIIPPIFIALDVSPLLAFSVLGTLASILNSSRQAY